MPREINIKRYKKCNGEEGSQNRIHNSLEEYEIIEIDYGLNNKEMKNKILSPEIEYKKKINISPIIHCIEKINKFFNEYIEYLQIFIKGLEFPLKNIREFIEGINKEVNSIKNNHIIQQKIFISKYLEFQSLNNNLKNIYNNAEDSIVNNYIEKKKCKNKNQELEKIENKLNLIIQEKIQQQNEIFEKFDLLGKFGKIFNDCTNQNINSIKDLCSALFQNFELFLNNIFKFFIKSFMKPMEHFLTGKKENSNDYEISIKKEFDELLEDYAQKVNKKDIKFKLDKYEIKIIEKKEFENEINDKVKFNQQIGNSLDEEEIFYIVKIMFDKFELIKKDNFDLKIEEKKIELKKIFDKLIYLIPQRNSSLKINNKNIKDCLNDKKNNIIDEGGGNLENIKSDKYIVNQKEIEKNIKEEVDYLCGYMNNRIYQKYILLKKNNLRSLGIFEIPKEIFNYFIQIFSEISKFIVFEDNTKKEIILDVDIVKLLIILSQTFYYMKEGKKEYIQKEIANNKAYHLIELWKKLIKNLIENEIKNVTESYIQAGNIDNENAIKERRNTVAFAQILPNLSAMHGFGLIKEEMKKIILPFFEEYEMSNENRKILLDTLENI